jgi:drug/metabolite transporter (DMT)-like permease
MKTTIVLISAVLAQALGNVLVSQGMKRAHPMFHGDPASWFPALFQVGLFPEVLLGTLFLILFFVLYAAALSWAELSFVLPTTAFGYILNLAFASAFLGEKVTPSRWAGSALITLGVLAVARSGVGQSKNKPG